MSELKIVLRNEQSAYLPRQRIEGVAGWQLDAPPRSVEVRLFWFTRGKGSDEVELIQTVNFPAPQQEEARVFSFNLPDQPYSFSGTLISLIWAIELVAEPGGHSSRLEIVMGPHGREITLGSVK